MGVKAKTAMKAKAVTKKIVMKKKSVSKIAIGKLARAAVFRGSKEKTTGGLTKATLIKNKGGKIVAKSASLRAKKAFASSALAKWAKATKEARKLLGIQGFCPLGGKTPQGKALYAKVKTFGLGRHPHPWARSVDEFACPSSSMTWSDRAGALWSCTAN